jgi:hypothetical protein
MRTAFVLFNEWVFVCERENERINVALIEEKNAEKKYYYYSKSHKNHSNHKEIERVSRLVIYWEM